MRAQTLLAALTLIPAGLLVADAKAQPLHHVDDQHWPIGCTIPVSRWAKPSDNGGYVMNLVGGGCWKLRRCHGPFDDDGTWGWDYGGLCLPRRIFLGWWHGRYQGGTGAYKTDGPHLFKHEE